MNDLKTPLTGAQKAAVVLMNMDQQRAAQVMKQFREEEAEEITAEILRLRRVDPAVAESAMTEFHDLTARAAVHAAAATTSPSAAGGVVRLGRATGVMDRLASSMAGKQFEFLDQADPGQVISLLDGELPQTIALVLAHLRPSTRRPCSPASSRRPAPTSRTPSRPWQRDSRSRRLIADHSEGGAGAVLAPARAVGGRGRRPAARRDHQPRRPDHREAPCSRAWSAATPSSPKRSARGCSSSATSSCSRRATFSRCSAASTPRCCRSR